MEAGWQAGSQGHTLASAALRHQPWRGGGGSPQPRSTGTLQPGRPALWTQGRGQAAAGAPGSGAGSLLLRRQAVPTHSPDTPGLRVQLSASRQPEPFLLQVPGRRGGGLHKVRLRGALAPSLGPRCPRLLPRPECPPVVTSQAPRPRALSQDGIGPPHPGTLQGLPQVRFFTAVFTE